MARRGVVDERASQPHQADEGLPATGRSQGQVGWEEVVAEVLEAQGARVDAVGGGSTESPEVGDMPLWFCLVSLSNSNSESNTRVVLREHS